MSEVRSVGLVSSTSKKKKDYWEAKKKIQEEFGDIKAPTMHPSYVEYRTEINNSPIFPKLYNPLCRHRIKYDGDV
jgi:hypothetical protein